jgi:hypothetical protein
MTRWRSLIVSGVFLAGSLPVVGAARASDGGSSDAGIDSSPSASDAGRIPGDSDTGVLPCGIARSSPLEAAREVDGALLEWALSLSPRERLRACSTATAALGKFADVPPAAR